LKWGRVPVWYDEEVEAHIWNSYVEGFKKDAEARMKEDVVVKFFRCTRVVVLKFPAWRYFHGTVYLPSVNKTGRLLAAFVRVTTDGITEEKETKNSSIETGT